MTMAIDYGSGAHCYSSDRNVRLWLVQIASRGVS